MHFVFVKRDKMKKVPLLLALVLVTTLTSAQTKFLYSPLKNLVVKIDCSQKQLQYSVFMSMGGSVYDGNLCIAPSSIGLKLGDGTVLGRNPKLLRVDSNSVDEKVPSSFYRKSQIPNRYNELVLTFKGNYKVVFRAYDQGVAYCFVTNFKQPIVVKNEIATFNFPGGVGMGAHQDYEPDVIVPFVSRQPKDGEPFDVQFGTSFENTYTETSLKKMDKSRLAFLPLMVKRDFFPSWESNTAVNHTQHVVITEANLRDYPGMYLQHKGDLTLEGVFAPCPKTWDQGGHNNLQYLVESREDYIAKTDGKRAFPWRVMAISEWAGDFLNNDMVYLLSEPSQVEDISWIKPGKVAWDWWNNWNIWGVDFEAGINNDTYKYYIDFASKSGIEYVILDEGWAVNGLADLFQVVPEIDLPELVQYAKERNVGIVLWAGYAAMDKDMEKVCKHYSEMGIKGFKVDFMDRDDQIVVNFYERMAATAAKYHLFIDFHGAYKPTGLSRTYPNVLNYEGVFGLEQCKWIGGDVDMMKYDLTIPFIRMMAGPMDYTQGAMRNASKGNYAPVWSEPMSQGTRCHQLAEYIVFDAPFSMLCDAPTAYMQEPECTQFIASVPTVWDETVPLQGKVGEVAMLAKRKGNVWYIGALTNWEKRTVTIDFKALGVQPKSVTAFVDGPNAHRKGCDYQKKEIAVPANGILKIDLAPGGGAVIEWGM